MNMDLTAAQKQLVSHPISKIIILFAMFYVSTRNIWWSIILILTYIVVINMLLNEKHPFNIFSKRWLANNGIGNFNDEEQNVKKPIDIYRENLKKLN